MSERPKTYLAVGYSPEKRLNWAKRILRGSARWAECKMSGSTIHVKEEFSDEELTITITVKVRDIATPRFAETPLTLRGIQKSR
jgi:hypothetical protein